MEHYNNAKSENKKQFKIRNEHEHFGNVLKATQMIIT